MDQQVSRLKFDREVEVIRGAGSAFTTGSGWSNLRTEYPTIEVAFTHPTSGRHIGFRFLCDDWDTQPPSLSLFDPVNGSELPWDRWPKQGWAAASPHPVTQKSFLCLPGLREFHIHPSHLGDSWDNLRNRDSCHLRYIIDRVRQKFEATRD